MSETALEVLGRLVAREVRDSAIGNVDHFLDGRYHGKHADFVRRLFDKHRHDPKALLYHFIPVIVDETISIFLQALDESMERVVIQVDEEGRTVSPYEYTDALEAEYRPDDGWIATYSRERRLIDE